MSSRKAARSLRELLLIRERLLAGAMLDSTDTLIIVELIEGIAADRDIREKYWKTVRGAPEKDLPKKTLGLLAIAINTTPETGADDALLERIAEDSGLTFDVLKHAYRKHLLPARTAANKNRARNQGDK
jgi:hypothetical protein